MPPKKPKWGERVEFMLEKMPADRRRHSDAVKHKGVEIHTLNELGGYQNRAIYKDFKVGKKYTLEMRTFWWIIVDG